MTIRPRTPPLDIAALSADQRRVYDAILAGPRGRMEAPLAIWLHSPELADRAQALGVFCRFGTSLNPRLSELAILVTASVWQAEYEWAVHAPIALRAGVRKETVDAIRDGEKPSFSSGEEAVVYAFAFELQSTRTVRTETYQRAIASLGLAATVELVGLLGYYGLISMTIRAFDIPPPADVG